MMTISAAHRESLHKLMTNLHSAHPHFMSRYSIIAPKTFSDLAADPKACASKSLVEVGLDADEFRCGHTKIMFRAGRLSRLEEIREGALTKIVLKKLSKYNDLKAQKNLLSSIQRNIRIYYAVRG